MRSVLLLLLFTVLHGSTPVAAQSAQKDSLAQQPIADFRLSPNLKVPSASDSVAQDMVGGILGGLLGCAIGGQLADSSGGCIALGLLGFFVGMGISSAL